MKFQKTLDFILAFIIGMLLAVGFADSCNGQSYEVKSGDTLTIPVNYDTVTGFDITSAQFNVFWDSTHFELVQVDMDSKWDSLGYLSIVDVVHASSGEVQIVAAGTVPLTSDSRMFNLVLASTPDITTTGFVEVQGKFNEEAYEVKTYNYDLDPLLPIELIDFNVYNASETVIVNWSTQSESNSSHFEVYAIPHRWTEDGRWIELGKNYVGRVEARGESSERTDYRETVFADAGVYRIMLRQFDLDGTFTDYYSSIVTIGMDTNRIGVYPNPTSGSFKIETVLATVGYVQISIYDVLGRNVGNVWSGNEAGRAIRDVSIDSLKSGIYFAVLKLQNGDIISTPITLIK